MSIISLAVWPGAARAGNLNEKKKSPKRTASRKKTSSSFAMSDSSGNGALPPPPAPRDLGTLRTCIDSVDTQLVSLLNERSRLVMEVGKRKVLDGSPVYAPHREQAVLAKVLSLNKGPTLDITIETIWREIMSGSFALERPLRIGYLGPPGSYSHDAAVKQFGTSVSYEDLRVIQGLLRLLLLHQLQGGHALPAT